MGIGVAVPNDSDTIGEDFGSEGLAVWRAPWLVPPEAFEQQRDMGMRAKRVRGAGDEFGDEVNAG